MKRMGLAVAVGALIMALLVPASVSATSHSAPPYWAQLNKAGCGHRGGQHGFGKVVLGMRGYAHNDMDDAITPNYIVVISRHQQKIDGVWVEGGLASATSPTYADGYAYTFQGFLQSAMHFESADHPLTRMLIRVEFWDDLPTGDILLGKVSTRTAAC
jgi:hypothetical protein